MRRWQPPCGWAVHMGDVGSGKSPCDSNGRLWYPGRRHRTQRDGGAAMTRWCLRLVAVVALAAPALAWAGNWADETRFPELQASKDICRKFIAVTPPAADRPDAKTVAALGQCDSDELYYGRDGSADPEAARACAFGGHDINDLGGDTMLMMIYANGVGAKRRLDVAIALACTVTTVAPVEIDWRVKHLYELMQRNWGGHDFDVCGYVTSGVMQNFCAMRDARTNDAENDAQADKVAGHWKTGPAADRLGKLRQMADAFIQSHVDNEISMLGTGSPAIVIDEQTRLNKQLDDDLAGFAAGKPPCAGAERAVGADAKLNAAYRKIQQAAEQEFYEASGHLTQAGIKDTQRAWLKFRDAWVAFVAAAYPGVSKDAVINWLTLRRIDQLEEID